MNMSTTPSKKLLLVNLTQTRTNMIMVVDSTKQKKTYDHTCVHFPDKVQTIQMKVNKMKTTLYRPLPSELRMHHQERPRLKSEWLDAHFPIKLRFYTTKRNMIHVAQRLINEYLSSK